MDMSQPPLQPPLHNDYDPLHYRQQQEYQQEGQSSMGMSMPYYESNPPTTMGGGWMYDTTQSLKYEMDQLMFQQHQLYSQIQNLTISLYETERSKEMQQSQIDLLLEQVADAEAYASAESNAALEYKANCTALGNIVSQLQQQIENWEQKCQQVEEDNRCKEEEIETLKEKLKRKEKELENMACGVELARLEKQKQAYHAEYEKKKSARHRGLFHWLFGWIYGDELSEDDSDEELEKLQVCRREL
jgi:DNA repair exonuclease SbcCD ATPase subunit